MITMFKNEAKVIRRMLESCYKYIDYWVVQDNGSTDGTDQIVKDFFEEKGVLDITISVKRVGLVLVGTETIFYRLA